jgi:hypothetical protein
MKICTKCVIEKELSEFHKNKTTKDGLSSHCNKCVRKYQLENKDKLAKYDKQFRKNNIEKIKKREKIYRNKNKKRISKYQVKYRKENKEELIKKRKEDYLKNKDKLNRRNLKWRHKNIEKCRLYQNNYCRKKRKSDINYKIKCTQRIRINSTLKNISKSIPTMFLIGCDTDYLMYHIQNQFKSGMNWDNHGRGLNNEKEWHIDHIKPCASFDLTKKSDQFKCFHYTNLQPLWAEDNLKKGNK